MDIFCRQKDEMLIELVRGNTALYDPTDKNVKNQVFKQRIWEKISGVLDIPIPDCKKRWKHFRDHYRKKIKIDSCQTKNTWGYMSKLTFLSQVPSQPEMQPNEQTEDYIDEESVPYFVKVTEQATDTDGEEAPNTETSPRRCTRSCSASSLQAKKRRKASMLELQQKCRLMKRAVLYQRILSSPPPQKSPVHRFFESMADTVSQFPPYLAAETRLKVCQVVTEMELQLLLSSPSPGSSRPSD